MWSVWIGSRDRRDRPGSGMDGLQRERAQRKVSRRTPHNDDDARQRVIDTDYMSGNSPVSLAAAAIYASAELLESQLTPEQQLTQREVSDVSDVTSVTIRTHYPVLIEFWEEAGNGVSADG